MEPNLIDPGNGVGMSWTVMSDGTLVDNGGSNPVGGYCLVGADDRVDDGVDDGVDDKEDALSKAKDHPFLALGGSKEVAESMGQNP